MTPILILAAGNSSRMRGRDKMLELVNGKPLLLHVAEQALGTGQPVFAALPGPESKRYEILKAAQVICFDVPDSAEGIGGTMRGGVKRLPSCDAFMITLADLPELETADFNAVLAAHDGSPEHLIWRGATEDKRPGHPILFDTKLRSRFHRLSGDQGGASIVKAMTDQTKLVPLPGKRALMDLDTPEDWAAWRASH